MPKEVPIKNPFGMSQWIAWISASVVAAATLSAFAYTNFQTKENAKEFKDDIEKRLDRIENKLDKLLEP